MDSTLCTSYKSYQKYRQNLPSFGAFCRDAAVALSQRPVVQQPLRPVEENTIETSVIEMGHSFSYNKRKFFNTQKEWIDLRLSKRNTHRSIRIVNATQLRCVLCCRSNHDIENRNHSRQGFKTSFECDVCKVTLCRAKRWAGGQSCFDKFHNAPTLPDPCQVPDELISTKSNENRAPPPSRKRSTSLDPPNRRTPTVRLANKARRRSLRLQLA
ncbi:hypothetical protein PHYSODRAFT_354453 [Phytophthora sojae]|uniref:PiggyBac transposable element-derived protein 4 C-terminal zinc-ribbon domain-containing protein n=1 Tax=Phytophthora sojae (strain P6497) TaxID=1094619 RepID=G4Z4W8_PHYSP|nr:hypothetical protein PHYSODRAFT_354453 [Phytophthora sojae]EGZ22297.1 hypothetical protein PHYSODRAFT_354453 [Phytophthora sojae]|eukprot:XP_009525014.1 hypothetical protein PHYSODRAFT_354453 [Phytophthora sojae]